MTIHSELKANLLMQGQTSSCDFISLVDASETRAPRGDYHARTEHLTTRWMSAGRWRRWFVAVGLGAAIALSASVTAFARVAVDPGDGGEVGGGGATADPGPPAPTADPRLLDNAPPEGGVWQHAHGSSANTGFAKVDTAPAASHRPFTYLGAIAPGANPVVGPNGDVYIGNLQGQLHAFRPDGTPYWTRQINGLHGGIFAAPVVGNDGSIYVVSSIHDANLKRNDSFLHKFSPGGAWVFATPFPEHSDFTNSARADRGATTAPPNIWRFNETEAIIIPMLYPGRYGGKDVRLIGFSTSGAVLGDQLVTPQPSPETTGGGNVGTGAWIKNCVAETWWFGGIFSCPIAGIYYGILNGETFERRPMPLEKAASPQPSVAIRTDPQGGAPVVMATDGRRDKIAYAFSPQSGFSQLARSTHTLRTFTTPPVVQGNGNTVTGTLDGYLTFTARNFDQLPAVGNLGTLTAAPTRLADGRLIVISREGRITSLSGGDITWQSQLVGKTIASAAASCTYFFVSTSDEFVTFDVKTMLPVARLLWVGGGLSSPVIGSGGYVYAIASDSLFVFAPPLYSRGITACDMPTTKPGGVFSQ